MTRILPIAVVLIGLFISSVQAQDAENARCIQNLNQAEDRYAAGNLQGIGNLLNGCIAADNYSKAEKIRAYKLLTLVAIFNDNELLAEENMVNLLKTDPEHEYDRILDPAEFISLYNKFRIQPIFRVGIKFGANLSETNVIASYNTDNTFSDPKTYSQELGFGGEISVEREFFKYFEGVGSIGYHRRSFSWSQSPFGFEGAADNAADGASLVQENQNWLDGNLAVRAFYRFNKLYPYVFGGIGFNYLLSNAETAERGAVSTGANVDLVETGNRNQLNYSAFGGLGLKYRIGVDFMTLEFRYINGLTDIVDSKNRYPIPTTFESEVGNNTTINNQRQDRLFKTGVVDDNFGINSLMVSIGFVKSIHSPKKLSAYQ
ncbi:MAG: hypothetical protein RIF33_15925 [Cyclobacteriaceae bacterium]